jgi:hypothetical protein
VERSVYDTGSSRSLKYQHLCQLVAGLYSVEQKYMTKGMTNNGLLNSHLNGQTRYLKNLTPSKSGDSDEE